MKIQKALITGGAGFIGSNLVKLLLSKGWRVRVLDNFSTGNRLNLRDSDVEIIDGDICNPETAKSACKDIDVVFHMAACVGRQRSIDNPQLDSTTNLIGTINILEGMRFQSVKRIIYSSSAAIFGELITSSIDETHPQNADSPYGVSKLAAEKMILAYASIYNIVGVCLRYFNIYGVNQRFDTYGNVIPIFAKRIYAGEKITIYGNGEQTRDFVNVKDIANANYLAATKAKDTGVFNLGSGSSISINDLAKMMQKISGIKVDIQYTPTRPADVLHCKAQTAKAERELGFKAAVTLKDGLKEYLAWFKENCA